MEIYKDIIDYEGIYQVSNFGNVKSLSRIIFNKGKYPVTSKEKILKPAIDSHGYLHLNLFKNGKRKTRSIHQLVAETFLNHIPCGHKLVVNHKDFNILNNHVNNLEIVTNRENCNKKHLKSTSEYVGVSWSNTFNKWQTHITIDGKIKNLGYFIDELEAAKAYLKVLNNL